MKPDPILEELWRVKDELAREAGYDIERMFDELRAAEILQKAFRRRRYRACVHEPPGRSGSQFSVTISRFSCSS